MIYLGADHRGYGLKEEIKKYFESQNVEFKDYGTYSTEVTHYPLIASKVCTDMDVEKDLVLVCQWLLISSRGFVLVYVLL